METTTGARELARATGAPRTVRISWGRPADALIRLSEEVDLLVIGSRRWGPLSRLFGAGRAPAGCLTPYS